MGIGTLALQWGEGIGDVFDHMLAFVLFSLELDDGVSIAPFFLRSWPPLAHHRIPRQPLTKY